MPSPGEFPSTFPAIYRRRCSDRCAGREAKAGSDDPMAPPWIVGVRAHERDRPCCRGRRIHRGSAEGTPARGRTEKETGPGYQDRQQRKTWVGQIGNRREGESSGRERKGREGKN